MISRKDIDIFLEGRDGLSVVENVNIDILNNATKYGVDLDALEIFSEKEPQKEIGVKKTSEGWRKLDVNLSDVVNMIIATSDRPAFLISDDKLEYLNSAAIQLLDLRVEKGIVGNNFLNLVVKEDWRILAENIGEMITDAKTMRIRLKSTTGKVIPISFRAIYLSDIEHFSFILLGDHIKKEVSSTFNNLYDEITGLPNFFLFEDRLQVAISLENAKDNIKDTSIIMVAAVNIDNIEVFRKMHIEDMIIKKIANNLVLNLPKITTIAQGLKYNFWIMLSGLKNKKDITQYVKKIFDVLKDGVDDNFMHHELLFSVGVSSFPYPARSAKKTIEQTIIAIKEAQANQKSSVKFYNNEEV